LHSLSATRRALTATIASSSADGLSARRVRPCWEDAVAAFDCVLTRELETKTHSVFLGEVRHVGISAATDPLVYFRSGFRGIRSVRDTVSLGNLESRRLSWSQFS